MSQDKLDCYILPSLPVPMLLPVECVAQVLEQAEIEALSESRAAWMRGHVNWRNQRLPVMSFADLHSGAHSSGVAGNNKSKDKGQALVVVLNPIPNAARKAYSALLCFGEAQSLAVDASVDMSDLPKGMDKRYVEATVSVDENTFVIPKLDALAVAFSYF